MNFRLGAGLRAAMWAERLEETSRDLGNLARETEGEILGLGSRLEEFAQEAGKVSQQAAGVVEAVQGSDQMVKASDIFSSACERLLTSNGEIASGLERLAAVGERLRGLFRFQRSLNHLTRTVRMLRVATRMETARLHDEQDELGMLADEIDKFSQRLDSHVGGFFDQAAEVAAETARLVAGLDLDRRGYKVRLDEAEGATQGALEQLTAILGQVAEISEMTSRRARDVVREVSEVVASLQFHDITRQQIDHVQTGLAEATGHLRGLAKGRLLRRWGRRAEAGLVRRVLMLQTSQLRQVRQEISESGRRVIDSLAGIAEGCQAQANDLAPIGGRDAEKCGLGQLEEQMASLAEILEQGSKLSRRMFDTTQAAAALLDKMEGSLHAIQSINEELNLLALNALVKVSRQAGGGRALAEVAQEVNRLSLEPRGTIVEAAEEVKVLLAEARELNTLQEAALAESHQQSEAVARAAEDALQGLRRLGRDVDNAVGRLASDSERLVYDINAVVSVVGFHRVVATRVDAALEVLGECGQALPGAGARESAPVELNLESGRLGALERHYTMESERRVHRKVVSREAPQAVAPQANSGGGSAEFGDNVDLF